MTRRWSHAKPLVGLRHVAMWPAYFLHLFIDYQLANTSSIGTSMVKALEHACFFKTDVQANRHHMLYINVHWHYEQRKMNDYLDANIIMIMWSRYHRQIEVNIGLYKPLFNQSGAGILVRGMTIQNSTLKILQKNNMKLFRCWRLRWQLSYSWV